jgi:hypothetical protein
METGESGVMSVSKLRNSTAIDQPLGITAVIAALKTNDGDQAQANKAAEDVPVKAELTADSVTKYLQRTSAVSCGEIDALISEMRRLREKLVADGGRIERGVAEFAALNQAVVRLTGVVSDGVAHIKVPSLAK